VGGVKITAQPHIWPDRNLGMAFARNADGLVISSACCLDCGWASEWSQWTRDTHHAGFDHICGVDPCTACGATQHGPGFDHHGLPLGLRADGDYPG
jgi:hypothetical protein